ncbi:hypothetical protein V5735_18430 (plasmid) [Haladaptatus sp. SPP-AMP-3]|uniref:hypothetical protein n=1 Tax=Haladaptatus sp. SPP-AMP-3 TaxID=3121295 RepID=UPI003C2DF26F
MRRPTILVFTLVVASAVGAMAIGTAEQQGDSKPNERWNRTYGGSGDDIFADIARTDDGGYVLAGETESDSSGIDGWVMKIDGNGDTEWERTFSGPGTDRLYSVVTTDDGIVAAGRTDRGGTPMGWVLELDSDGETRRERTPGTGAFYGVEQDGNGYVLAGWTRGDGGVGGWLVKHDTSGAKAWERTYATPDGSTGRFKAVVPTNDGYLLAGEVESGGQDAWILRVGDNGERQWQRTLGGADREAVWAATGDEDGIVVAGESESGESRDGWVFRYDASGERQWEKRFGGGEVDWLDSAMRTDDGGYLFTGGTLTGGIGSADGYVVKTGADGTLQWEKAYGSDAWDKPWPAIRTHDGGFLLAGQTGGFGAEAKDGWVLELGPGSMTAATNDTSADEATSTSGTTTTGEESTPQADSPSSNTSLPGFTVPIAVVAVVILGLWRGRRS